jgi:hypothetical protein
MEGSGVPSAVASGLSEGPGRPLSSFEDHEGLAEVEVVSEAATAAIATVGSGFAAAGDMFVGFQEGPATTAQCVSVQQVAIPPYDGVQDVNVGMAGRADGRGHGP